MVRSFFDPAMITDGMAQMAAAASSSSPQKLFPTTPSFAANSVPFDAAVFAETARKNLQAFAEVGQLAMESWQRAFEHQTQAANRMIEDQSAFTREILVTGTPEEKIRRQADIMRLSYEHGVRSSRELGTILNKAGDDAAHVINRRVSASLTEIKAAFEPKSRKGAASGKNAAND